MLSTMRYCFLRTSKAIAKVNNSIATLAQLVERHICNVNVAGAIPAGGFVT